jgi:hypothetical protein
MAIVPPKQCRKGISHIVKFVLFIICSNDAQKDTTIVVASTPYIQQKQIVEEKEDIFFFTYNGSYTMTHQA